MLTLDKWIKEEPKPYGDVSIFIDVPDVVRVLKNKNKILDYEGLIPFFKTRYGAEVRVYLYIGSYEKDCVSLGCYRQQEEFFTSLTTLGYYIKRCVKYIGSSKEVIVKGPEVSLTIDMVHYGHPSSSAPDRFDVGIVVCDEWAKYRRVIKECRGQYKKKIKIFSLSQLYEENNNDFIEFIEKAGRSPKFSDNNEIPVKFEKPFRPANVFGLLEPNTLRTRVKNRSERSERSERGQSKGKNTCLFIDYGNVFHSFMEFKKHHPSLKTMTESELFSKLKRKAEASNNLTNSYLFMGIPQLKINEVNTLRNKQEQLKSILANQGFEICQSFNETLYRGGMKERGVDLGMGYKMIECALGGHMEKAILVSGDADFVPVVRKLRELNNEVEIWSFIQPERNSPLSPFLFYELSKNNRNLNGSIKPIESLLGRL